MRKFAVISGFLGSGKTTAMMALTNYCTRHGKKAAMISNDLGEGVTLADHRYAMLNGCNAIEMTDECICFRNEELAENLNTLYDEGCELVVSDIPGFGVGALEHVYHGLSEKFPGAFSLAPFTVLIEPETAEQLRNHPDSDLSIIARAQLMEADLIVLTKCDLLKGKIIADVKAWLTMQFPHAQVIAISSRQGTGLPELCNALLKEDASMQHPEIDYDGDPLQNAMGRLSEYYLQYHAVVCCNTFDGNAYLLELAQEIRAALQAAGTEIPHLKLLAWAEEGDFGKVDVIGTWRSPEVNHRFALNCTEVAVILNGTAFCGYEELEELIADAVYGVSKRYQLTVTVFKKQCFSLGEEEDTPVRKATSDYYSDITVRQGGHMRTNVCYCGPEQYPRFMREILAELPAEINDRSYGCGSPVPLVLEGCRVLDLGCGTGRDAYLASRLTGPSGKVIAIDMNEDQLKVAKKYYFRLMELQGYANLEFKKGYLEHLDGIEDASIDVVISNCVLNLVEDKETAFREIFRVLKDGGELYFSDIFSDRRIPSEINRDSVLYGECLGGVMYTEDFRRMMRRCGFEDFRIITDCPVRIDNPEIELRVGNISYRSRTIRAMKLSEYLEDRCEQYGQVVTYLGGIRGAENAFDLDDHHHFQEGLPAAVCGNTCAMIEHTRFGKYFSVYGDRSRHYGLFEGCGTGNNKEGKGGCC